MIRCLELIAYEIQAKQIKKKEGKGMEAEEKVDATTAEGERMGFFHGERKEAIERTVERIFEIMKEENLSMMQSEHLISVLSRRIQESKSELLANSKIE